MRRRRVVALPGHVLSADRGPVLNAVIAHPTQRRLLIALVVTLACLPLLVIDVVSGSARSSATEVQAPSSDSSLVLATRSDDGEAGAVELVDPSSVEIDSPTVDPPPTVAPTTTVARQVQQATTTTTVPRPATTSRPRTSDAEFLACVKIRESHGDYTASDPTGTFLGAYQIYQGGWDSIAAAIGRDDLVGVPPNHASPADQDTIAAAMLARNGRSPWGNACS